MSSYSSACHTDPPPPTKTLTGPDGSINKSEHNGDAAQTLKCDPGYSFNNTGDSFTVRCNATTNYTWEQANVIPDCVPKCLEVTANAVPTPENVTQIGEMKVEKNDAKVTYNCSEEGYVFDNAENRDAFVLECNDKSQYRWGNGSRIPACVPRCLNAELNPLKLPDHTKQEGNWTGNGPNASVSLSCSQPGYIFNNSETLFTLQCDTTTQFRWEDASRVLPCVPMCQVLARDIFQNNTVVTQVGNVQYNNAEAAVKVKCNDSLGYVFNDSSPEDFTFRCNATTNFVWNDSAIPECIPRCLNAELNPLKLPDHTKQEGNWTGNGPNAWVSLSCSQTGYMFNNGERSFTLQCDATSQFKWEDASHVLPCVLTCQVLAREILQNNTDVTQVGNVQYNDAEADVKVKCNDSLGYVFNDSSPEEFTFRCNATTNFVWNDSAIPGCIPRCQSDTPSVPQNKTAEVALVDLQNGFEGVAGFSETRFKCIDPGSRFKMAVANSLEEFFNVTCNNVTQYKWETDNIPQCVPKCLNAVPNVPEGRKNLERNVTNPFMDNSSFAQVEFRCQEGFNFQGSFLDDVYELNCTHVTGYKWNGNASFVEECIAICSDEVNNPLLLNETSKVMRKGNTTTLDGNSTAAAEATLTCQDGYEFVTKQENVTITCNATTNYTWDTSGDIPDCVPKCTADLPVGPPNQENLDNTTDIGDPLNASVNFRCRQGFHFERNDDHNTGGDVVTIRCNGGNNFTWDQLPSPLPKCVETTTTPPPTTTTPPPTTEVTTEVTTAATTEVTTDVTSSSSAATTTTPVVTTEQTTSSPAVPSTMAESTTAEETSPTSTAVPSSTTRRPVMPTLPPETQEYRHTSDYHYPRIEMNGTMEPDAGASPPLPQGPFGFGEAVALADTCVRVDQFPREEHKECFKDLTKCDHGISLSIWEKIELHENDTQDRYIFSTGGELDGDSSRAGVALYHRGLDLHALVSNGTHYWTLYVIGQVKNNSWSNVGIKWKADEGLKLFVQMTQVGWMRFPENPTEMKKKPVLDTAVGAVGCKVNVNKQARKRRDLLDDGSSQVTYSDFANASFDEFAIWAKALSENETLYFLGGWSNETAGMSLNDIRERLSNFDLERDRDLLPGVVRAVGRMSESGSSQMDGSDAEPETPKSVNGIEVVLYEPQPGDPEPDATTPAPSNAQLSDAEKNLEKSQDRSKGLQSMTDIITLLSKLVPGNMSVDEYKNNRGFLQTVSNVFSPAYKDDWKKLRDEKRSCASKIVESVQDWSVKSLDNINMTGITEKQDMTYTTQNMVMVGIKINSKDLEKKRGLVEPNYHNKEWDKVEWNVEASTGLEDTVKIPETFLSHVADEDNASIAVNVFNTYNEFAPLRVRKSSGKLPSERTFIDGKVLALAVSPRDGVEKMLKVNPITITIGHNNRQEPLRRNLLFHDENQTIPYVKRRYCARWLRGSTTDKDGVKNGTWTTEGCEMLVDTAEYTMCDCHFPGIFAVIAQNITRKLVEPDPEWLWITKYVGYGVSVFLLVVYILIILCSKHLKDQFHIMRVHLSLAVIGGTACIFASDYYRGMRHECTAISACMQYLYTAAGMWLLMEAFAIFWSVITGYVGGRLKAYIPLAWGFPAFMLGCCFAGNMEDYGLEERCMISWNDDLKWTFFGPMLACGVLALMFCGISICNMSFAQLRRDFYFEDIGSVSKGLFCIIALFIMTWSFACFAYLDIEQVDPDFYPIFQVLNSWLGILIFLFMGIGSKKFRLVLTCRGKKNEPPMPGNFVPVKPQPKY